MDTAGPALLWSVVRSLPLLARLFESLITRDFVRIGITTPDSELSDQFGNSFIFSKENKQTFSEFWSSISWFPAGRPRFRTGFALSQIRGVRGPIQGYHDQAGQRSSGNPFKRGTPFTANRSDTATEPHRNRWPTRRVVVRRGVGGRRERKNKEKRNISSCV